MSAEEAESPITSRDLLLELNEKQSNSIDRLLESGLYGKTREEVAMRLIDAGLMQPRYYPYE